MGTHCIGTKYTVMIMINRHLIQDIYSLQFLHQHYTLVCEAGFSYLSSSLAFQSINRFYVTSCTHLKHNNNWEMVLMGWGDGPRA